MLTAASSSHHQTHRWQCTAGAPHPPAPLGRIGHVHELGHSLARNSEPRRQVWGRRHRWNTECASRLSRLLLAPNASLTLPDQVFKQRTMPMIAVHGGARSHLTLSVAILGKIVFATHRYSHSAPTDRIGQLGYFRILTGHAHRRSVKLAGAHCMVQSR